MGGGYAGKVNDSTKVTIDGKTFLHRVYGGGFGDPFSTKNNETGQIGGNTEVYIQGAKIYGDVFGGGAGVAPKEDINGTYTYFTDVAKVLGTTKVEISGEAKIYGNVYGGGDIANIKPYSLLTGADKKAYYNKSQRANQSSTRLQASSLAMRQRTIPPSSISPVATSSEKYLAVERVSRKLMLLIIIRWEESTATLWYTW